MVLKNILASIGIGLLASNKEEEPVFLGFFCSAWRAGDDAYSRSSNLITFFIYRKISGGDCPYRRWDPDRIRDAIDI